MRTCSDLGSDFSEMMIRGRPQIVPSRVYVPRQLDETPEDYRKLGLGKCFEGIRDTDSVKELSCRINRNSNY